MKCPYCDNIDTKVVDSRQAEDGTSVRRRRACDVCREKFTTYEKLEIIPISVIKENGLRESFDRNKMLRGIIRSCYKTEISTAQMEELANNIEAALQNSMRKEVSSKEIGEHVMTGLKSLSDVAYVRFASVYRQFKDIDTFMAEITKILTERKS